MAVDNSGLVDEIGTCGSEEELHPHLQSTCGIWNQAIEIRKGGIKPESKIWATHRMPGEYVLPKKF